MGEQDRKQVKRDTWVTDQVTKSEYFYQKCQEYGLLEIAYAIEGIQGEKLKWDQDKLGISSAAWDKVIHRGIKPIRVFAHPQVLVMVNRSVGYYQKLALVSLKSMSRIGLNIYLYESGDNKRPLPYSKAQSFAHRLNELISRLIEQIEKLDVREFDLWRGMTAGSTAQGSWGNRKGDVAEELIKGILRRRIRDKKLIAVGGSSEDARITLTDGRVAEFASEPDSALYDKEDRILVALEIKGGIDEAGVLERVGAAIKSLSRAKQENPEAVTVLVMYQVSMTAQARQDLESHQGDIDHWFTIEDILNKSDTRENIFGLLNI